jgi:hypothetical protein
MICAEVPFLMGKSVNGRGSSLPQSNGIPELCSLITGRNAIEPNNAVVVAILNDGAERGERLLHV